MQPLGALKPGLPSLSAIPQDWPTVVLYLKDCFYTIPLAPQDKEKFAFSVSSINQQASMKWYQWKMLPQGMMNSPMLCQQYMGSALEGTQSLFPQACIIHYMDNILLAAQRYLS